MASLIEAPSFACMDVLPSIPVLEATAHANRISALRNARCQLRACCLRTPCFGRAAQLDSTRDSLLFARPATDITATALLLILIAAMGEFIESAYMGHYNK